LTLKIEPPSRDELERNYNAYGSTISSIARYYKTSNPTVRKWLIDYGITRKNHKEASIEANNRHKIKIKPTKELLENLYENMSIDELELYFKVGQQTIYEWLEEYQITLKTLSHACSVGKQKSWNRSVPPKEDITEQYKILGGIKSLCDVYDLSPSSIRKILKGYNIEIIKPWRSYAEIKLFEYASTLGDFQHSNKSLINPYELDIVSDEHKLAIEYCGLYWHSDLNGKNKDYHINKKKMCDKIGYSLLTIFETDSEDFAKSLLSIKLGKASKIYARACDVRIITSDEARDFNNTNHVHGHRPGSFYSGLFYNNELVQVLTMGKSRFSNAFEWECTRMAGKKYTTVVGGASKLFSHFRKIMDPKSIITYADKRFGDGKVYENCGFKREEDTPPAYWYFLKKDPTKLLSRIQFQKHKLTNMPSYSPKLTEWDIMSTSGYDRIWDCGHSKFVWHK
jgi:transposase